VVSKGEGFGGVRPYGLFRPVAGQESGAGKNSKGGREIWERRGARRKTECQKREVVHPRKKIDKTVPILSYGT